MDEVRLHSPAAMRNRDAILAVLRGALPATGKLLEIASGTGEHVVHLAAAFSGWMFQPSDPDAARRASIDARARDGGLANIRPALDIDTTRLDWGIAAADAVLCSNMIHIAPWPAALGLIAGAARVLPSGGRFFLYGPFRRDGQHTADSNAAFDADLRSRDPAWGIRDLATVAAAAQMAGFAMPDVTAMPANNFVVMFQRR